MKAFVDGPSSQLFTPIDIRGGINRSELPQSGISTTMSRFLEHAPGGACVGWGIPFEIGNPILSIDQPSEVDLGKIKTSWLIFLHTADYRPHQQKQDGFVDSLRGQGALGEHAVDYVVIYDDGSEVLCPVKRRFQIGSFQRMWGENCFEAVSHHKPHPVSAGLGQSITPESWGWRQAKATAADFPMPWTNWIWPWHNPHPEKEITALRLEPKNGIVALFGITASDIQGSPVRWESRKKAMLTMPDEETFDPSIDKNGCFKHIQLDLGQIISANLCPDYPNDTWAETDNNSLPTLSSQKLLIEYTAHPQACFHLVSGDRIKLEEINSASADQSLQVIPPSSQRVRLRTVEKSSGKPIAVKLHAHGEYGEYLAPLDRHREPNVFWFQDYSVDWSHNGIHHCTYIPGETSIDLPLGKVYIEVSKGFEIKPIRKVIEITSSTEELTIELEKVLPWREKGWVTADTHVHFLSPHSARLEGAGEGVNIINLLASQWGELMTNVGDFDGETTLGSKETGYDGEYIVRVGTENRQHVLGHISLLGYSGNIITPLCSGGPDESALGDPVEVLLTEWARQCKRQNGLVIIPHFFPGPQCEHSAAIVSGQVDGIEMTAWGDLYHGIDPYSVSDWYRYLNNGYLVAAVGGTDKMTANTAVGTVRTYAHIDIDKEFTYENWKLAVRKAKTFVTYGPLMEFSVEGEPPGTRLEMRKSGGEISVEWKVASTTIPMTKVELICNGEIIESDSVNAWEDNGNWTTKITQSSWLALLVRGQYTDKPEIIAAHSSPVMVQVDQTTLTAGADMVTILEQIEGAMAYIDTVGTRADEKTYKRMRLELTAAHRELHNRLHQVGHYHSHAAVTDHQEHH